MIRSPGPNLLEADRWFQTAHAQCHCSEGLLQLLAAGALPQSYFHAKVAVFLLEQALENFLKAALCLSDRKCPPRGHDLHKLFTSFQKAFPNVAFDDAANILLFVKCAEPGNPNQFLRYPVSLDGNQWDDACSGYVIDEWLPRVRLFGTEFSRLETAMKRADENLAAEPAG